MEPIIVTSPLAGEWHALNSPGNKIPSHGTHHWAMTYAYDFIRLGTSSNGKVSWHTQSMTSYLTRGVTLEQCYGWGAPIFSPIDGVVRDVTNGVKERQRLHVLSDLGVALYNELFFSYAHGDIHSLAGNYLIIEGKDCCAFLAHIKQGSIQVGVGQLVHAGERIAQVGHSGNSTIPHLHFQLMDDVAIKKAKGLACGFAHYERQTPQGWQPVAHGVPSSEYVIRFNNTLLAG